MQHKQSKKEYAKMLKEYRKGAKLVYIVLSPEDIHHSLLVGTLIPTIERKVNEMNLVFSTYSVSFGLSLSEGPKPGKWGVWVTQKS